MIQDLWNALVYSAGSSMLLILLRSELQATWKEKVVKILSQNSWVRKFSHPHVDILEQLATVWFVLTCDDTACVPWNFDI